MAARWSVAVPQGDHWYVTTLAWLRHLEGAPWSSLFHHQMNDSRLDAAQFLHYSLAALTGMNTRAESLVCVALAAISGAGLAWLLRKYQPGGPALALILAWFCVVVWFTPDQTMNWMYGVQIPYMLVVAASLGVVLIFATGWPLAWRVVAAAACALISTYSFAVGMLAWGLGAACLAFEPEGVRFRSRAWWTASLAWVAMTAVTLFTFFQGYVTEVTNTTDTPTLQRLRADPLSFAKYGLSLLGMPFSKGWLYWNRQESIDFSFALSPWVGAASLVVFAAVLLAWCRKSQRETWGRGQWIFLLIAFWSLAITAAIALARTGIQISSPFQNRYLALTLWFHFGLLALLAGLKGTPWNWTRGVWLILLLAGYVVGVFNGIDQGRRDEAHYRTAAASAALRHAAPEPMWLDYLAPGIGSRLPGMLDTLAANGCLHVPTIKSDLVSEAARTPEGWYVGSLKQWKLEDGSPCITAWALDTRTRNAVDAVVISFQTEGEPERWLGMGQRRTMVPSSAAKHRSRAVEDRIGWAYIHGKGEDEAFLRPGPNPFKAKPLPKGKVTFRAYAFDTATGAFSPLKGSCELELP